MDMLTPKDAAEVLRGHGFKATPQRLAVYRMLSHTTAHPNAETIYKELQPLYPTMSLATVYKTVAILCEVGLAQELNVGEDAFRYDANTSAHPHIRCVVCGRVDDVFSLDTHGIEEQAAAETGYALTGHQVYFFGVCPACQAERARKGTGKDAPVQRLEKVV